MRTSSVLFAWAMVVALATPSIAGAVSNKEIQERLFEFSLAYELQKKCNRADPRIFRALGFRNSTYARARELGISNAQLDAYIDDEAAKAAMQRRVDKYISAQGLTVGSESSYCTLAAQEIARGSASGNLIRMK